MAYGVVCSIHGIPQMLIGKQLFGGNQRFVCLLQSIVNEFLHIISHRDTPFLSAFRTMGEQRSGLLSNS